jgi:PQQ enzyme-like repeat protein
MLSGLPHRAICSIDAELKAKGKIPAVWTRTASVALVTALLVGIVNRGAQAATASTAEARAQSVTNYHGGPTRSGAYVMPGLTWERARGVHIDPSFDGRVEGHIYSQPLLWQSPKTNRKLLLVATEDDVVYALDANSGKVAWQKSLGRPAKSSELPCGNIDPLGITGTPVIDDDKGTIYLDAMVAPEDGSGPQHLVFGLAADDGSVLPGFPVNIAQALKTLGMTFRPGLQNERGALAIAGRTLFIPYGGHFGDCGPYHGWVVGISLEDPHTIKAWATRAAGGGVWAPGGISYDGHSLFVATGNTKGAEEWADGEAVIRLGPDLKGPTSNRDFFAPTDWKKLDDNDQDLGGTNPLPVDLSDGTHVVLALGKDGKAYLLNRDNLGGIGGGLAEEKVSRGLIITAPALYAASDGTSMVAFEGQGTRCPNGISNPDLTVLKIRARPSPMISTAWCGSAGGRGSPIVTTTGDNSNPIVWMVGAEGDGRLHGFRGDNGEPLFTGGGPQDTLEGLRHFVTILATEGRLFVAGDGRIYAFTQ